MLSACPTEMITTQSAMITISFFNISHPSMGASAKVVLLSLPLNYSEQVLWKLAVLLHLTTIHTDAYNCSSCPQLPSSMVWMCPGGGGWSIPLSIAIWVISSFTSYSFTCPAAATITHGQTEPYLPAPLFRPHTMILKQFKGLYRFICNL